jgi:class 3 adenylate cyclase/CheY-like chemotaxis protein
METILIIDDDSRHLDSIKGIIEDDFPEAKVLTASNENDAIKIINSKVVFDVIITDLKMDDDIKAGLRVIEEAKKNDPFSMVILVTAFPEELNRQEAFKLGAFDCLEKTGVNYRFAGEISYKTKSALFVRNIAVKIIENEKKYEKEIGTYKKYFDPLIFEKIKLDTNLLDPKNRTVTIVFWDIRNFSVLSEKLKANSELIAGFLKEFFEASSRIIFKHSGVLDKFIGDGVMALFGAFNEDPNDESKYAISAIEAAKELKKEFNEIYIQWKNKWQLVSPDVFDISLGCGIHTGTVLVGNLGTVQRDHFTAIGPHVNIASRIEGSSINGEIRFSASTNVRVSKRFITTKVDTLSFKNMPGPFDIFTIV